MPSSAICSIARTDLPDAVKITFPLESTVFTSRNPAFSNARFSSGIFAFIGLTPRRNATYRLFIYVFASLFVPAEAHSTPGHVEKTCSAVGLRNLFWLQRNRRRFIALLHEPCLKPRIRAISVSPLPLRTPPKSVSIRVHPWLR